MSELGSELPTVLVSDLGIELEVVTITETIGALASELMCVYK